MHKTKPIMTKGGPMEHEEVSACPVCHSKRRTLLHKGLTDRVFACVEGSWDLWRCAACDSGYLNPRPTKQTIHLAYVRYYTHQAPGREKVPGSLRDWRNRLAHGYARYRYGARVEGASAFGVPIALVIPYLRWFVDRVYRHLPKPPAGGQLLDVGCGAGKFLVDARSCGWEVTGVDPDAKAVETASREGIRVLHGGLECFQGQKNLFDVITLSHVIEHVYDPAETIRQCCALLRPGGVLWLETPNIDSLGHERFGPDLFSLDPPRHLVLFNDKALKDLLKTCGFCEIRMFFNPRACPDIHRKSYAVRQGLVPHSKYRVPLRIKVEARLNDLREYFNPARREVLTILARKPRKARPSDSRT
jgi:2-polyprenyl-3-methyl-5-hydroxy-6-metoxy-1,4-benzoquinol methylase